MSPMRRELYGPGWETFSEHIRFERAEGRCECTGECGGWHPGQEGESNTLRCPREHGHTIAEYTLDNRDQRKVVLTTAHLCPDKACRDERHVLAMCQRCHLHLDRMHHARNASRTRDAKAGQERMFDA